MLLPVPNLFPISTGLPYRLAIIGDAPGLDEASWTECLRCHYQFASVYKLTDKSAIKGVEILQECTICPNCQKMLQHDLAKSIPTPFIGIAGQLLNDQLARVGILRTGCFLGNVVQTRPPKGDLKAYDWDGPEFESGRQALLKDLLNFKPNLVLALGATALRFCKAHQDSIDNWRGSLFKSCQDFKTLATIHPATVLREYDYMPMFKFDLAKAAREAETPVLTLPVRDLQVDDKQEAILARLEDIRQHKIEISPDIEGRIDTMYCLSLAKSAYQSFIIPTINQFWTLQNEVRFWSVFSDIMSDPTIPKVFQNGLYDLFVLKWSYGITVRGVVDDTMLKHWEIYSELPKALGFQASIYTNEPYWKNEREHDDIRVRHEYCCKDSAVTFECRDSMERHFIQHKASREHYQFNLQLLEPILFMELRGINYDKELADQKLRRCERGIFRLQWAINFISGVHRDRTKEDWLRTCFEQHGLCKSTCPSYPSGLRSCCKQTIDREDLERVIELLTGIGPLSIADEGELSILCNVHLNVSSTKVLQHYLYETLGLPKQFKKVGGKLTDKETSEQLALLHLWKKTHDPVLQIILKMRYLLTRSRSLAAEVDRDGRIRCGYNVVGTKTGRISCYESPTGSGFNLQTATKKDRDLFIADLGYWFFQCDLSGADGWTVAAHCAACGDRTMLDDYLFGLKPARIVALLYQFGAEVLTWSRERLKAEGKKIDSNGWLYFACKVVQHMSNYQGSARTIVDQILRASYKILGDPILITETVAKTLQDLYFKRYPGIKSWWRKSEQQLRNHGFLISASGHKRIFFGRRSDYKTLSDFLAEEPQQNTTYVTNKVLLQCWSDPENRSPVLPSQGSPGSFEQHFHSLRIQPAHQVHDAFIGQFRQSETAWAVRKVASWFDFTINIAGISIKIPYEGGYGPSWGDLSVGII